MLGSISCLIGASGKTLMDLKYLPHGRPKQGKSICGRTKSLSFSNPPYSSQGTRETGEMLSQLLVILDLLLWMTPHSSSKQIDPSALDADTPPTFCKGIEVPPPFGYYNTTPSGFALICNTSKSGNLSMLPLGSRNYQIKSISIEGEVSIFAGAIAGSCDNNKILHQGSGWLDLDKSPYTLSDRRNKLTAIGCDVMALLRGSGGDGNLMSGCVSFCDTPGSVINGSCSGLGCCQAAIPKGIKSFNITFKRIEDDLLFCSAEQRIGDNTSLGGNSSRQCSQAFFVDQENFEFSQANLSSSLPNEDNHVIVLDWAIGDETCEEAMRMPTYACKQNSQCHDSPRGVGYLCKCKAGYQGNPYSKDGCQDVDECSDQKTNPCVGDCINIPGNVSCACPSGTTGDGRKQGSGCKKIFHPELALGLGLGLLLISVAASFWSYSFLKKRKLIQMKAKFFQQNGGLLLQQQITSLGIDATTKIFTTEELEKATNSFNESQIVGRGGYGTVYKGVLPGQKAIAIKKSKLVDGSQIEQFINEVVILSEISHRNIVKLLGCCLETPVPLLVYEFIPNGTLFNHIHGKVLAFILRWEDRLRIATETAGALAYLHSAASVPIIHRDIKSANILLDENYTTKVSDFGASRSLPFDQTHITTLVQGTFGYLDPEYFRTSQLTEKSDVYSFGVVLAELLTGEMPVSLARSEEHRSLATYFVSMLDKQCLLQVMDPQVVGEAGRDQLLVVAQLVRRCLNLKGEDRPMMKEVAMELDGLRRFRMQQLVQQNRKEMECMLAKGGPSIRYSTDDMSRLHSLENHMLASMDLPR